MGAPVDYCVALRFLHDLKKSRESGSDPLAALHDLGSVVTAGVVAMAQWGQVLSQTFQKFL